MVFSERLAKLRKEKGINQKQCAEALGEEPANYNKWESGKNRPDFETVCKIAKFYGTTVDYLFGLTELRYWQNLDLDNFGEFSRLFFVLAGSNAVYKIHLHPNFSEFEEKFLKMLELYKDGTIDKETFDYWCEGIINKYKHLSIKKELNRPYEEALLAKTIPDESQNDIMREALGDEEYFKEFN